MRRRARHRALHCCGAAALAGLLGADATSAAESSQAPSAYADFTDSRSPPPYRTLTADEQVQYELGHALFNTTWVAAGTANAARRDGLGPLYNAASCDACHNEGARSQGPAGNGPLGSGRAPDGLILQLQGPGRSADAGAGDAPDPVYGHVLNTAAIEGQPPEAVIDIEYRARNGRYADGTSWQLREPHYRITKLVNGPLAARTLIKPRLAPALFGVGLLQAVPAQAGRSAERFGWQGAAHSVEDQTARAFSREMGLSSAQRPHDDCSAAQSACRTAPDGGEPEVSSEFMAALVAFQQWLAVPLAAVPALPTERGAALFADSGCVACHAPSLPLPGIDGLTQIHAYTDLRRHDLGAALADQRVDGSRVASRWRTAPLWGMANALRPNRSLGLMHDGRARSIEEAILWHDGEAYAARQRFEQLPAAQRAILCEWIARL
ncbi:MAG: di-heme oxidoredictase family protein [Steroidobacteraceae bacterium]